MEIIVTKVCEYCKKIYIVPNSQKDRSKFCSDKCFRASRNTQTEYNCDYCGKTFLVPQREIDKVSSGKKKGLYCCAQCAKDVQKPSWDEIQMVFEERNYTLVSTEYISSKTKLEYICNKHKDKGIQGITWNNIRHGFGCPYCGEERRIDKRRSTFEYAKEVFAKHDMELLNQPYINAKTPMEYICIHHRDYGVQLMTLDNAHKQHCPLCHKSKGETKIMEFLKEHNIRYIPQYKIEDEEVSDNRALLSYDFYLIDFNKYIEYQGEQHDHPVDIFGGEEAFKKQCERDRRKRKYAEDVGVELIEIWYTDFNNIEKILTNKLLANSA